MPQCRSLIHSFLVVFLFHLPTYAEDFQRFECFEAFFSWAENFTKINSRNSDNEIWAFSLKNIPESEHPYALKIIDNNCNLLYHEAFDDHPLSIFSLTEVGESIFSIWTSANSYIIHVIYFDASGKAKKIFEKHSTEPPSFILGNSKTMPDIVVHNKKSSDKYIFKNGMYLIDKFKKSQ